MFTGVGCVDAKLNVSNVTFVFTFYFAFTGKTWYDIYIYIYNVVIFQSKCACMCKAIKDADKNIKICHPISGP